MYFIIGLCALIAFQLIGELLSQYPTFKSLISVPGPVLGMFLLFLWLIAFQRKALKLNHHITASANALLSHLSLLFIPAGVGLIVYLDQLQSQWLAVVLAVIAGTVISMISTAICLVCLNQILFLFKKLK